MGESKEEIQPTASVLPESLPEAEPKNKKAFKILGYVLGVVFSISLGAFGFWFYQQKTAPESALPAASYPPPTPFVSQGEIIISSDRNAYRNKALGFEFKYPSAWYIEENPGGQIHITNYDTNKAPGREYDPSLDAGLLKIEIYIKDNYSNVDKWIDFYRNEKDPVTGKDYELLNLKEIEVAGHRGVFYELGGWGLTGHTVFETPKDELIHFVGTLDYEGNKSAYDQILSAFKFLDQVTVPADWKTYRNEKWGYLIKYPPVGLKEGVDDKIVLWEKTDKRIAEGTEAPPATPFVSIEAASMPAGATLDQYVQSKEITPGNQEFTRLLNKKQFFFNELEGTEYTYEFSENGQRWYPIYLVSGLKIFRISSQKQYIKDGSFFDQVFSTFKFLD